MTAEQFNIALGIAKSNRNLLDVDMDALHGFGLSDFVPVAVPIEAAARCIRWQAQQMNGGWDSEALSECHYFFVKRRRVDVLIPVNACPCCGK
jgi:hypothetical protein